MTASGPLAPVVHGAKHGDAGSYRTCLALGIHLLAEGVLERPAALFPDSRARQRG